MVIPFGLLEIELQKIEGGVNFAAICLEEGSAAVFFGNVGYRIGGDVHLLSESVWDRGDLIKLVENIYNFDSKQSGKAPERISLMYPPKSANDPIEIFERNYC
ncbi:MAG: hypothetical protein IH845_01445 [Nanoarchaeota archaeon]|nr:hypothetical protein [Nanoarchaeota archaeon]